jgi:AcrR family transcriptional regulator
MTTDGRHERVRLAILEAAETQFAVLGYHAVSMEHIARSAGVSRASVFNHFQSKRLILDEMAARSLRAYGDRIRDVLAMRPDSTTSAIWMLCDVMTAGLERNRALYRDVFPEIRKLSLGLDARLHSTRLKREALELLADIFRLGVQRGDVGGSVAPEHAAIAFDSLLSGAVAAWLTDPSAPPLSSILHPLCRIFLEGVSARSHEG